MSDEIKQKRRGRPSLTDEQKLQAIEKNRIRANERIKSKYKEDPEFRTEHIRRCGEYNRKCREAFKALKTV